MIDQFISLWQCKQFAVFVRPPPSSSISDLERQDNVDGDTEFEDQLKKSKTLDTNYIFSPILSPLYVFTQQNQPTDSFDKMAQLIIKLIKNGLMSVAYLNEQCTKLMRIEWKQVLFNQIQTTVNAICNGICFFFMFCRQH